MWGPVRALLAVQELLTSLHEPCSEEKHRKIRDAGAQPNCAACPLYMLQSLLCKIACLQPFVAVRSSEARAARLRVRRGPLQAAPGDSPHLYRQH